MMSSPIDSVISKKDIMIIHPYSQSEIQNPTFGGTRLIAEQISYLKEKGNKVSVISLAQIGSMTSLLYRMQANLRGKESSKAKSKTARYNANSEKQRWWLNLFQVLINEYSARLDILYRQSAKALVKAQETGSIIIYHYPYGASYFASAARKKGLTFVLYQHNIEWRFFEDHLGEGFVRKVFVPKARAIEKKSMHSSDLVAFVSERDRLSVLKDCQIEDSKTTSWIPIVRRSVQKITAQIPVSVSEKIKGKTVVGFVGTNFEPNIVAVENIIRLANDSSDSIVFLIMGSVNRAFENRKDLPQNIVFTGYVQELDAYLSHCDIFVSPKTTSDTGIETKMFDYLKFDKYIISTESGASGFDSNDKVVVSSIDEMLSKINSLHLLEANRI